MARTTEDKAKTPHPSGQQPPLDAELDHSMGTTLGAVAGGAAAGAAAGTVAGPVGTAIGAAAGALAGAVAGKKTAELRDAHSDDAYWREHFLQHSYVPAQASYDDWGPAYRYGEHARKQYGAVPYAQVQGDLGRGWGEAKGDSKLSWDEAAPAVRDGWLHCDEQEQ